MKINEKGQVLISFILILPFILVIMAVIVDQGLLLYEKNELNNMIEDICVYKDKNDEEIKQLIIANDNEIFDINIKRKDKLELSFKKNQKAFFGKIIGYKNYELKIKKEC